MSKKKKNRNGPVITYKWEPTKDELEEMKTLHNADMRSVVGKYMLNKYSGYTSDAQLEDMKSRIKRLGEV